MASGKTLQSTIEISGVLSPSLQAAIKNAVGKLEEMSKETLASAGAAEKLTAEIGAQESVLKSLQKGYADYIVSGQESSDEAQILANKIQELTGELDKNRGTLQAAERAAKSLTQQQVDTADAYTKLEREINSQQSELSALRREYANVVLEQGESSDEARQLASRISDLSGELNQNKQKLSEAERAADAFGDSLEEAGQDAENSSDGFTVMKGAIADLVADGIEKAVEAFKELATEGDTALGMLEARTGAAGDKMAGFEDVMYEVYNANYGDSLGDVSEKLSAVIQMTDDLDNASLAKVTKNAIALEDVFGFDVTESMRAANSLMDQFGITSDEAFNLIVQGAQNGLNQNDDLLDTINEYSVQFKNAGYSADDMFNMLSNGVESGTWSVDKLGDAVKEMNIRLSDGTADEALQALGLGFAESAVDAAKLERAALDVSKAETNIADAQRDANEALSKYGENSTEYKKALDKVTDAKYDLSDAQKKYNEIAGETEYNLDDIKEKLAAGGETAQGAMKQIMSALMNVEDEQERYMLGQTLMGTMWEDLGEDAVAALMSTEGSIKSTSDAMEKMDSAAYDTLESSLSQLGRTIKSEVVQPIADKLIPVAKDAVNFVKNNVAPAVDWILNNLPTISVLIAGISAAVVAFKWGSIVSGIMKAVGAVKAFGAALMANPIGLIIVAVTALVAAFVYLWNNCEGFRDFWINLWEKIKSAVGAAAEWIKNAWGTITTFFSETWDKIKNAFSTAWTGIVSFFTETWNSIKTTATNAWNGIASFFTNAWNNIKTVFSNVWNGITSFLSGAWETIKNVVQVGVMFVGSILDAAFQIITLPFRFIWENCKEYVFAAWEWIKGKVSAAINAVSSVISTVMSKIRSVISTIWNAIKTVTSSVWNGIKSVISTVWNAISAKVAAVVNAVKSAVSTAWNTIKSVTSSAWNSVKSVISTVWNAIKAAVSAAINAVKSVVSSVWNGIKSVTSSVWNGIKSTVSSVWDGIKSGVSSAVNTVKSTVSSVWNSIKSVTSRVWNGIKSAIITPIETAKGKIKGIVDAIKGFFSNMKISLPKIKLPHFKVSGSFSLSPPSVPKLSIDWYKDGGIMTKPTIFGASGSTLMAGGEAGAEAVLPLKVLWDKMESIFRKILNDQSSTGGTSDEGLTNKAGELLTLENFSLGSLADGTNVVIYYDFSNFTWSPKIQTGGTGNDEDDLMARLRAHEAEFFDWLEEFIKMREVAQYA